MGTYWTTMQIPRGCIELISKYSETDKAVENELTNKTRIVSFACNQFLDIFYDKNTKFRIFKELNYNEFDSEQKKIVDEHDLEIISLQKEIQEKIRILNFNQEFVPNFKIPENTKKRGTGYLTCYHPFEDKLKHSDESYELVESPNDELKLYVKYFDSNTKSKVITYFVIKNDVLFCSQGHNDCEAAHSVFDDADLRLFLTDRKIALIFPPKIKLYE